MTPIKDNFSGHASDYAKYRPVYPPELVSYLSALAPAHELAWDCATGNGQMASLLSQHFAQVIGTDISESQLRNAVQKPNITYKVEQAESSSLKSGSVDLVVVAQAVHWFDFDRFYSEVKRVLKPGSIIAVVSYGLLKATPALDKVINKLYEEVLGTYWDPERRYLDEAYSTIPFPFKEEQAPTFTIKYNWAFKDIIGYLNTWSAAKHYEKAQHHNPIALLEQQIQEAFGEKDTVEVRFEVLLRVGRV